LNKEAKEEAKEKQKETIIKQPMTVYSGHCRISRGNNETL